MIVDSSARFPIKMWTEGCDFEEEAQQQLRNLASLPFIFHHVAAMPDVHWGMGATVGSVIATKGAIIPAAVGVDIGCGMIAAKLNLIASDLPDSLSKIRSLIESRVPHGRTDNGGPNDRGAWSVEPITFENLADTGISLLDDLLRIVEKHPKLNGRRSAFERAACHLGTLGTGNHFIELCLDPSDSVWIVLHSGSRGVGNTIGTYFINRAKEKMKQYFIDLPDLDLAYLPESTQDFDDYFEAVEWAQEYAAENRERMLRATICALQESLGRPIGIQDHAVNCHHNYVAREKHFGTNVFLTRKGAVSARKDQLGIIPGSMGTKSYIVRGLGNLESFHSCSHGAGRAMSRTEAKRRFTIADHIEATLGVECRKDSSVLDETPGAYKPIENVMKAQLDLVEIVTELKQIVCVKG